MNKEYISELLAEFNRFANPERAKQQSAYLKNQFSFFGLMTQERRNIQKPFLVKAFLPYPSQQLHHNILNPFTRQQFINPIDGVVR